jgi:D-glycero-D-manno-heptose 1,7-bisphosphate phosphatase
MTQHRNKAIFLDRDGVINHDHGYVAEVAKFALIQGAIEACLALQRMGYLLVVVTNQSGIGRGYYSASDYQILTQHMQDLLGAQGVNLAEIYHCPHYAPPETQQCACRKPQPGMLLQAQQKFNIDLSQSVMVGDKLTDVQAAERAGVAHKILVRSGQALPMDAKAHADVVLDSLSEVPLWLSTSI